jgi:hypothetical protein
VKAPFSDDLITWEKFSWDDNLKVLDLDRTVITQENFRQQRNAFYYDYLSSLLDRPFMSGSGRPLIGLYIYDNYDVVERFLRRTYWAFRRNASFF